METNRDRIERRLIREGWYLIRHGSNHDVYGHANHDNTIRLPRHRTVSMGVARQIAKTAGWDER
ncbi:MAG: type II toxin-antitoxin system HicA family toxin [Dehalococcoidia bacterium]|nr:type II toxin-antitoxin system HicA family toxin [Dehalococcoidia bacterium]